MFRITDKGVLQHLYFGKRLGVFDARSATDLGFEWSHTYLDCDGAERNYSDNYYNDKSLAEVASHGLMDKSGAAFVIVRTVRLRPNLFTRRTEFTTANLN